ncbi:MAG TPA: DUF3090 family protein [Acidimicrobiales bacterium]|nr:DUF3090 family protein [Acidimicrobiales bacterium]
MSQSFDLPSPARVTVGAVGPPGKRVFYLQARQDESLLSLKLEKQQVLFLAGGLSEVLADLASPSAVPQEGELALEEPVEAAWVVGSMQLAYDPGADRVVLVAREVGSGDDQGGDEGDEGLGEEEALGEEEGASAPAVGADLGEGPNLQGPGTVGEPRGVARVLLTREQAAGVIEHGKRLLRGGRPPCPLCGYPLDQEHSCPKTNGHRAPSL